MKLGIFVGLTKNINYSRKTQLYMLEVQHTINIHMILSESGHLGEKLEREGTAERMSPKLNL